MKYFVESYPKIEKRLAFLAEKSSVTRVAEIENVLGYGYLVDLTEDDLKDESQKEYWEKEELREVLRQLNNERDL